MNTSKCFAVIGNPIEHSVSPQIHQYFADHTGISLSYQKIKGSEEFLERQITQFFNEGGCGLNITLPFKQKAYDVAKKRTTRCNQAGAANTLWMENNTLCADNTDGIGLIRDLEKHMELTGRHILILGTGGAARGIIPALLEANPAQLTLVGRTQAKAAILQNEFPQIKTAALYTFSGEVHLIINATSASLKGETVLLPQLLSAQKPWCYDLTYNLKQNTAFVEYALSLNCRALDGLGMLVEQAAEAFFIWNKVFPETSSILNFLR